MSLKISVAIPESSLSDESLKSAKTRKASVMARICAIFGVKTIYVYRESKGSGSEIDFLIMMLRYLETPQYLRRKIFPRINDLKFAGVLLPLRIPSHLTSMDPESLKKGQVREGLVVHARGGRFVDAGVGRLLSYRGKEPPGKRVTVAVQEIGPAPVVRDVAREEIKEYWGYDVKRRASLRSLLAQWKGDVLVTSRRGKPLAGGYAPKSSDLLVVFGSPERGVHEILGGMGGIHNARTVNFFPEQKTATVRLEEAMMGTLSIICAQPRMGGRGVC